MRVFSVEKMESRISKRFQKSLKKDVFGIKNQKNIKKLTFVSLFDLINLGIDLAFVHYMNRKKQ